MNKDWYDFFVVSQSARQGKCFLIENVVNIITGTVSPTHYHVVKDSSGLQPEYLQLLTYKLCHLYYNWPGTIRVPAPCQYAHKVAFLVGQSLHATPNPKLADKLHYL